MSTAVLALSMGLDLTSRFNTASLATEREAVPRQHRCALLNCVHTLVRLVIDDHVSRLLQDAANAFESTCGRQ